MLQQASRTVPLVFAQGLDPVGASFVESLARPGGNATGFNQLDYSLAGKWLELLKESRPRSRAWQFSENRAPPGSANGLFSRPSRAPWASS